MVCQDFEGEIDGRSERKTKILNSEGAREKNEFKEDRQNAALNRWKEKNAWSIYTQNARDS